jgi:fatty acid-binding protein DegV
MTDKVESSFVIDTLKYLHRGGRCSGVAALGANVLKLKPCIEVKDGKMDVGKKYRGNFDKVILQYVEDKLGGREDLDTRRIFITHPPGMDQKIIDSVFEAVRKFGKFDEILKRTPAAPSRITAARLFRRPVLPEVKYVYS